GHWRRLRHPPRRLRDVRAGAGGGGAGPTRARRRRRARGGDGRGGRDDQRGAAARRARPRRRHHHHARAGVGRGCGRGRRPVPGRDGADGDARLPLPRRGRAADQLPPPALVTPRARERVRRARARPRRLPPRRRGGLPVLQLRRLHAHRVTPPPTSGGGTARESTGYRKPLVAVVSTPIPALPSSRYIVSTGSKAMVRLVPSSEAKTSPCSSGTTTSSVMW